MAGIERVFCKTQRAAAAGNSARGSGEAAWHSIGWIVSRDATRPAWRSAGRSWLSSSAFPSSPRSRPVVSRASATARSSRLRRRPPSIPSSRTFSAQPIPGSGGDREMTVIQALGQSVARIGESFGEQPLVGAAVRRTIGLTYISLGRYAEAEPLLLEARAPREAVFGAEHEDTRKAVLELERSIRRGESRRRRSARCRGVSSSVGAGTA